MSHQRYPSHDAVKEPHSVSLKVLRLSRPSLVTQFPLQPPLSDPSSRQQPLAPASLAYSPHDGSDVDTNPAPFVLSPILNLPPSFGSAYVGETFSCTLCASHDALNLLAPGQDESSLPDVARSIRDVRIKAEMKTPGAGAPVTPLELGPDTGGADKDKGVDLAPGETLQKVVDFDLKEEGNHVLAVTVSYYEATDVSGRTRTFRKLYQFICKASLVVRTKSGPLPVGGQGQRRWVLEAQLENCGEDAMRLEKVEMSLEPGLVYSDCNWEASGSQMPLLHPGEAEQVCFVVEEVVGGGEKVDERAREEDGRVVFGALGIGWRGEMGSRGFLSTGQLGTRHVKPKKVAA